MFIFIFARMLKDIHQDIASSGSVRTRFATVENDTGILRESVRNHDALVFHEGKEAEVWLDPVDGNRCLYYLQYYFNKIRNKYSYLSDEFIIKLYKATNFSVILSI